MVNASVATQAEQGGDAYRAEDACAAELLCDRHPADAVAFRVVEPDLTVRELTFGELAAKSRQVAAVLADKGIGRGDAVGVLMSKSADLPAVLLGIWRLGAVHVPLFTAFARPAIELRLEGSGARAWSWRTPTRRPSCSPSPAPRLPTGT
jgi:acetyl-CoA synthetase